MMNHCSLGLDTQTWFCLAAAEREWMHPSISVSQAFSKNRMNRALQWLPLLLAKPGDSVWLYGMPADPSWKSPKGVQLNRLSEESPCAERPQNLWLWAHSKIASNLFSTPDATNILRSLGSKATLIQWGLSPPGSIWATSFQELLKWRVAHPGPAVCKAPCDSSGKGHVLIYHEGHLDPSSVSHQRLTRMLQKFGGFVVQPWWPRLLDFSSQWRLEDKPIYLGATLLHNTYEGQYLKSMAGPSGWLEELLGDFWSEHLHHSYLALQRCINQGYRGPCGVDAMIIRTDDGIACIPIVELNVRHTMGWLVVALARKENSWATFTLSRDGRAGIFPRLMTSDIGLEHVGIQPVWQKDHLQPLLDFEIALQPLKTALVNTKT